MKSILSFILTLLLFVNTAICEELSDDKKKLIDELLTITNAADIGQMFSKAIISQMTKVMKSANPDVDPRAFDIVEEEVNALIHEEVVVKNSLNAMIYPIYDKYFTQNDLAELVAFYKTPLGKKLISVTPSITQESMQVGHSWGQSLGPKIQQRVSDRLKREGIKTN